MLSLSKEQEQLLNDWLTKEITNALGFSEPFVVSLASGLVSRELPQNEIEEQLQEFLGEHTHDLVEKVLQELPKIRQYKKPEKRKQYEEIAEEESHKRRRSEREDREERRRREKERERERERRHREREKERRSSHREGDRDREREKERRRHKEREREKERERAKEKDRERNEKDLKEFSHQKETSSAPPEEPPKPIKPEKKEQREKNVSVDIKVPQKLVVESSSKEEAPAPSEEVETKPVPSISVDSISSMLQDLQAHKQALKQELLKAQKEQQQQDLLMKNLKRRQIAKEVEKDISKEKEKDIKEKTKKVAGLNMSIAERISKLEKLTKTEKKEESKASTDATKFMPPPLLLDEKGREIDAKGNILSRQKDSVATLKANQSFRVKQKLADLVIPGESSAKKSSKFFDPNLKVKNVDRPKKTFNFLEAGYHIKKAQKLREQTEEGIKEESEEEFVAPTKPKEPIPEVEWWDKELLQNETYDDIEKDQLKMSNITIYVEHPVPVRPPGTPKKPITMTMFLTKKERKKLRKRTRMEREKERQERILLGIEEPPKPKVKISNLMRVLNKEAVQDPTQIEQEVRKQMAERIQNHEARNQARKLTKEERKEKMKQKLLRDLEKTGTHVAVFKIRDLSNPKLKFRVDVNARALQLTGCVILYKDMNLVVVEGGARAIRKYKKILMQRIDWNPPVEEKENGEDQTENGTTKPKTENEEKEEDTKSNQCFLVWEGTIMKPNFQSFRFETMTSEESIRKYLNRNWSEQYWDMCKNFKEPEGEI